jgi:endonuclease/exonuclease/phosphatase family metal-dependent hydrolase
MSRLVLATYNVHGCVGRDRRRDPARIARVVRELDADVIALQEIEFEHDGPELLPGLDGYDVHLGATLRRRAGHYGNALLVRHAVRSVQRHDLSHGRREARGALDVVLDLALDGRRVELRVLATHLGLSPRERRGQVERLLRELEHGEHRDCAHTALLGDFNEWRAGARALRSIERTFGRAPRAASWPSRRPILALDRIWVRPHGALLELAVHDSALARSASDHLPVRALIDCASWPGSPPERA